MILNWGQMTLEIRRNLDRCNLGACNRVKTQVHFISHLYKVHYDELSIKNNLNI